MGFSWSDVGPPENERELELAELGFELSPPMGPRLRLFARTGGLLMFDEIHS
jgi:hypothetical protein